MDRIPLAASFSPVSHVNNDALSVFALFQAIKKHKLLVIGVPLIFALIAALASLAIPNTYRANTKILPREQSQTNTATLLNQLGSARGALSIRIPMDPNSRLPVDLYIGILKSRSVADSLVQRFNLKKVYGVTTIEQARIALSARTLVTSGKDGLISIEVEDMVPERAAEIANAYSEELLKMTKSLTLSSSSQRRNYYERQHQLAQQKLTTAQAATKGGAADSSKGSTGTNLKLRQAVQLRAQIEAKEIQLSALQAFSSDDSSQYSQNQREITQMREELTKLEANGASYNQAQQDVIYYQYLSGILAKYLADARLEEAQDASLIKVLDPAVIPERHSSPNRPFIVEIAFILGLIGALLWIFVSDVMPNRRADGQREHLKAQPF